MLSRVNFLRVRLSIFHFLLLCKLISQRLLNSLAVRLRYARQGGESMACLVVLIRDASSNDRAHQRSNVSKEILPSILSSADVGESLLIEICQYAMKYLIGMARMCIFWI